MMEEDLTLGKFIFIEFKAWLFPLPPNSKGQHVAGND